MMILRKGFKLSEVSRQMNSIPAAQRSHCIKGAAANAEELQPPKGKVNGTHGRQESRWFRLAAQRELQYDAERLVAPQRAVRCSYDDGACGRASGDRSCNFRTRYDGERRCGAVESDARHASQIRYECNHVRSYF